MELRVLRYFLAVAQEENISRAAEMLHVSQPTLSRQLAELEEELGVTLFRRGNRQITLTDQGFLLRRRAEEITALVGKIEEEVKESNGPLTGTVVFGAAESASTEEVLPLLMQSFSQKYPQVHYEFYTATADLLKERLDRGLIDIGLVTDPVDMSKYEFIRLPHRELWGILTRKDSALAEKSVVTAEDLQEVPLVLPWRREVRDMLDVWIGERAGELNVISTYNLAANVIPLVSKGLGHALMFEYAWNMSRDPNLCFRPMSPELTVGTALIWKRQQPASEAVKRFIQDATIRFCNS